MPGLKRRPSGARPRTRLPSFTTAPVGALWMRTEAGSRWAGRGEDAGVGFLGGVARAVGPDGAGGVAGRGAGVEGAERGAEAAAWAGEGDRGEGVVGSGG